VSVLLIIGGRCFKVDYIYAQYDINVLMWHATWTNMGS